MKRAIIIHGWEGTPEHGWTPWLKRELIKRGYEVETPVMPNTANPKVDEWVSHLQDVIKEPTEGTILIGHSLAGITILRYLEELNEGERIGAAIFVAGFALDLNYEEYKGELSGFFQTPVNFEKVSKHCDKFIALHSKDDKWVDIQNAYLLEEKLGAKAVIQDGMSHYSGDDGINELPILLDLIGELNS